MTMNKAEKAAMQELRERAALTWPPFEKPRPMNIAAEQERTGDRLIVGWWMNSYEPRVAQGCSNGIHHSIWSTTETHSQQAGRFYRTELEAWRALRWEATESVAQKLGAIDAQIAALGMAQQGGV